MLSLWLIGSTLSRTMRLSLGEAAFDVRARSVFA